MPLVSVTVNSVTDAPLSPTARSTVQRGKKRAVTDRAALRAVLDAGLICHMSTVVDGAPLVLPTAYGRDGDTLYLHGSSGAQSLRTAAEGVEVCVGITLVDGIVYARSVFNHSMNYRSAVVHGTAVAVTDSAEKTEALRVITEHAAPGSWGYARMPTDKELAKTSVLALDLTEAAVKIRTGDPGDDESDIAESTIWSGVLPIRQVWGEPQSSSDLPPDAPSAPKHVTDRIPAE